MKGLVYPKGHLSLRVPAARNYGWWEQGVGDEGAQLGLRGSVLEPVSVHAGHSVLLFSEDREKRKMKVEPQQEGFEYNGCSGRF